MNEQLSIEEAEELRLWAINRMKWERTIASERGKRLPAIKGGEKSLNRAVQAALAMREHPKLGRTHPSKRAKAAVKIIAEGLKIAV